ncbi:sigma-70 family RNA polymerase sigma factor [bacterium]|nr:sigma-70 family RNA polymerase sigma factor [bacterium]
MDAVFAKRVTSLDKKINDDDDDNLQSVIPDINSESPDYDIEQRSTTEAILSALDTSLKKPSDPWKPDPKEIIRLYFYEGKTLEEIAERFDISRERVRQIRDRALKSLKHNKTLQDLHDTLNE